MLKLRSQWTVVAVLRGGKNTVLKNSCGVSHLSTRAEAMALRNHYLNRMENGETILGTPVEDIQVRRRMVSPWQIVRE